MTNETEASLNRILESLSELKKQIDEIDKGFVRIQSEVREIRNDEERRYYARVVG